jgi:hypothetical protein
MVMTTAMVVMLVISRQDDGLRLSNKQNIRKVISHPHNKYPRTEEPLTQTSTHVDRINLILPIILLIRPSQLLPTQNQPIREHAQKHALREVK